jgi:lysophospholipase L1-like esterase
MASRQTSVVKNLLLAVSSFCIAILTLAVGYELVERVRYERWRASYDNGGNFGRITIPSPNPVLMWEYKPYGERPDRPVVRTNRWGFRERDYDRLEKPEGTDRIAFIGDSVTLGFYVEERDTFVRLVEECPRGDVGCPIQALNFGIDGYNTIQIHELLSDRVLAHQPDLVVYTFCLNDFDFEDSSGEKIRYFREPRSFLLHGVERLLARLRDQDYHRRHFEKNRDRVFAELLGMRDLLEQRGIPLLVAILPVFYDDFEEYSLEDLHEELAGFLRDRGIAHLDLLPTFSSRSAGRERLAFDIWHPTPLGHRLIAGALMSPMREVLASTRAVPTE